MSNGETIIVTGNKVQVEGLTPDFKITADNEDRTEVLQERLLSINFVDNSGKEADTLELVFDDSHDENPHQGGAIEYPKKGVKLALSLGYQETGLISIGTFVVDEPELAINPDTLTIRARSADFSKSETGTIKKSKTRHFDNKTIGQILSQIAGENGLKSSISAKLADIQITHISQTNESDGHFLTRLAKLNDALFSVKNHSLIFVAKDDAKSASGKELPIIQLSRRDFIDSATMSNPSRNAYGTVRAKWRNKTKAHTEVESAGSGEPIRTMRHIYASQAEAARAANAELKRLNRATGGTVSFSVSGRPEFTAGAKINISNVRTGFDGEWKITRVTHNLDWSSNGYTCQIEGEKP